MLLVGDHRHAVLLTLCAVDDGTAMVTYVDNGDTDAMMIMLHGYCGHSGLHP